MTPLAIEVQRLYHHYEEGVPALAGVDLAIAENAFLAVIGQNGSGKTTLVKHLNGLLKPTAGVVRVFGVDTRRASVSTLARTVGFAFQNPDHQIFCASTVEEVAFGPRNLGLDATSVQERVADALAAFGLEAYSHVPPSVLGFGLRRKVALASVYAMRPRILILDEPTAGLDYGAAQELMALLHRLHAQGHTLIWVSHDMRLVAEHAPEAVVLHEGRVLAQGPTRQVLFQTELLQRASLAPPPIVALSARLTDLGLGGMLTVAELAQAYARARERRP